MKLTTKQTNWLIFGSIGLLLLALIIFLIVRYRATRPQIKAGNIPAGGVTPSTFTDVINRDLKLKKGDRGNNVIELQKKLNTKGAGLLPDGIYGNDTLAAMKAQVAYPTYYQDNGISWNELQTEQNNASQTSTGGAGGGSGYNPPSDSTGVGNYGTGGVYDPMGYYNGAGGGGSW